MIPNGYASLETSPRLCDAVVEDVVHVRNGSSKGEQRLMTTSPSVVVHVRDITLDDRVRESIERSCGRLAEEFPEVDRFEISVAEDGAGFAVQGRAMGKNTAVTTHAVATDAGPAADQVLDKIERQLRKVHDKRIFSQRREAQKDPPKRKVAS
jgi:ribosomal subunit interface protein